MCIRDRMSEEGQTLMLYGVKGEHYDVDGSGNVVNLLGKTEDGVQKNVSDVDSGTLLYSFVSLNENVIYPWTDNSETLLKIKEMTLANGKITAPLQYYNGENILSLGQALDEYSESEYVNLIMGDRNQFDSKWDNFVRTYLTTYQGQKVMDEYNLSLIHI